MLRSREESDVWNSRFRGALRSAVANRQWPQQRCHSAGFTSHNKCCLCARRLAGSVAAPDGVRDLHLALAPQPLQATPVGTAFHRVVACPAHGSLRSRHATPRWRALVASEPPRPVAVCRALFGSLDHTIPPPADVESFKWIVRPPDGVYRGVIYTDGSRLDGPSRSLARNWWAFVVVDEQGRAVAAAHGAPPPWIDDIPGTESWAILQAAQHAEPGCLYRCDCAPCIDAIHRGRKWATQGCRPLARVHSMMFTAIDDTPASAFVWMPAHTREHEVGRVLLGNGQPLTAIDRNSNELADRYAKQAVLEHRIRQDIRIQVRELDRLVVDTAKWLGMVTYQANHYGQPPMRDSEASRQRAARAGRAGPCGQRAWRKPMVASARPPALGGHTPVLVGKRWVCTVCAFSTKLHRSIAVQRCMGPPEAR